MINVNLESGYQYIKKFSELFNWCLEKTSIYAQKGDIEQALGWASIAAQCAWSGHPGFFSSPSLENMLIDLGQSLSSVSFAPRLNCEKGKTGRRILHVLSTAYSIGGHTRLVKRWIENAFPNEIHSIVVTNQEYSPIPDWLEYAVKATGGDLLILDTKAALTVRASMLREVARVWADMVILHIHPDDPTPIAAFATDDLPPIVLLNHADHVFWLGSSVADIVADIRPAGQSLSLKRRNVRKSTILPIPLSGCNSRRWTKNKAKQVLGFPEDAPVLLSVGSAYKYQPIGGYSFVDYSLSLINQIPDAILIVIGPDNKGMWKEANKLSNGRIRAIGVKENLQIYYAATDIYLEGFPVSSLTAMLEASLAGANPINAPMILSPILSSDDISLNNYRLTFDGLAEYIETIKRFTYDKAESRKRAEEIRNQVILDHCKEGWRTYLAELERRCPDKHTVKKLPEAQKSITHVDLVWALFQGEALRSKPLYSAVLNFGHRVRFADTIKGIFKIIGSEGFLIGGKCILTFAKKRIKRAIGQVKNRYRGSKVILERDSNA